MTVLAANTWPTNADLIADVAELGYLRKEWLTLDPTYGRGLWWTKWRPDQLVQRDSSTHEGFDFRCMTPVLRPMLPAELERGWNDCTFDAVAFDPPYVSVGGRQTTGMGELHDRYGMTNAARSPKLVQDDIDTGLHECARVLKPRGYLLVKCQDYISSGKLWPGTFLTIRAATENTLAHRGLTLVDRFEHVATSPRPQPGGRRQVHARRNLSTLLVFRKPAR